MSPYRGEYAQAPGIRPVESVGLIVSDLAVLQALQSRYARRPLPAEQIRAAKLVTLVAFVRAGESEVAEHTAPWSAEFPLDPEPLARVIGLQPAHVVGAIGHLREAGILQQVQSAGSVWYRLTEGVFERSASAEELDWPAILARLEGESAALLVVRALADLLPPPLANWAPVRLSALAEHTGYGTITVRKGKDVLVGAGILDEDAQPGQSSRYRFTEFARGIGAPPAPAGPDLGPPPVAAVAPPTAVDPPPATNGSPTGTVAVQVAGLTLELPPGTVLRVEAVADGRQLVRVGDHLVIGPL